jgi:hypothetical protein
MSQQSNGDPLASTLLQRSMPELDFIRGVVIFLVFIDHTLGGIDLSGWAGKLRTLANAGLLVSR